MQGDSLHFLRHSTTCKPPNPTPNPPPTHPPTGPHGQISCRALQHAHIPHLVCSRGGQGACAFRGSGSPCMCPGTSRRQAPPKAAGRRPGGSSALGSQSLGDRGEMGGGRRVQVLAGRDGRGGGQKGREGIWTPSRAQGKMIHVLLRQAMGGATDRVWRAQRGTTGGARRTVSPTKGTCVGLAFSNGYISREGQLHQQQQRLQRHQQGAAAATIASTNTAAKQTRHSITLTLAPVGHQEGCGA